MASSLPAAMATVMSEPWDGVDEDETTPWLVPSFGAWPSDRSRLLADALLDCGMYSVVEHGSKGQDRPRGIQDLQISHSPKALLALPVFSQDSELLPMVVALKLTAIL